MAPMRGREAVSGASEGYMAEALCRRPPGGPASTERPWGAPYRRPQPSVLARPQTPYTLRDKVL